MNCKVIFAAISLKPNNFFKSNVEMENLRSQLKSEMEQTSQIKVILEQLKPSKENEDMVIHVVLFTSVQFQLTDPPFRQNVEKIRVS